MLHICNMMKWWQFEKGNQFIMHLLQKSVDKTHFETENNFIDCNISAFDDFWLPMEKFRLQNYFVVAINWNWFCIFSQFFLCHSLLFFISSILFISYPMLWYTAIKITELHVKIALNVETISFHYIHSLFIIL